MVLHGIAGGGTARGNLDFAIDRSQMVVDGTGADDQLLGDVRIRQIIKYTNYKRFGSKSKIIYEGQELPPGEQKQPPQQPPQQPAPK